MSSISKTNPLVEILELQGLRGKPAAESVLKVERKRKKRAGALGAWTADYVVKRIATIEADDPKREHKAYRVFLEGTLACLTASPDVAEPGFQAVVDRVQQALQDDAELGQASKRVAQQILSGAIGVEALQKLFEAQAKTPRPSISG